MKINVVTGGGTGIGKAVAAMRPKDEQVIITGRRMDKLNKAVEELKAAVEKDHRDMSEMR